MPMLAATVQVVASNRHKVSGGLEPDARFGTRYAKDRITQESTILSHDDLEFHNREDELERVVGNLSATGGKRLFHVIGMPTMGKSRFLHQVPVELRRRGVSVYHAPYLDLAAVETAAAETSELGVSHLLLSLFDGDGWRATGADLPTVATARILRSRKPWVLLLDNLDVLDEQQAAALRAFCSQTLTGLRQVGMGDEFAVVAASRREIPSLKRFQPAPRFEPVVLRHFGDTVVISVLRSVTSAGKRVEQSAAQDIALPSAAEAAPPYDELAGLPALLASYLQRVRAGELDLALESTEVSRQRVLEQVVTPHVEQTMLDPAALLPPGLLAAVEPSALGPVRTALEELVLCTASVRLVTRSHLKLLAERYPSLEAQLETLRGLCPDVYDLFGTLSIVEPTPELWFAQYACARRLLFRYRYASADAQLAAHRQAQAIYQSWSELAAAGQVRFLVERLWHEVELARIARVPRPRRVILGHLDHLIALTGTEFRGTFHRHIRSDSELLKALDRAAPGLAAELLGLLKPASPRSR